jgi:hypothetical protein
MLVIDGLLGRFTIAFLLLCSVAVASDRAAPDTAVVCPNEFRAALEPWLQLRRGDGRVVELLSNDGSADDIRARIREAGHGGKLQNVLLVGGNRFVPTHLETAKVTVRWGSEPQIAADDWYGDLDGDGVPDVAIGRLTVESADELKTVVKKILAYERQADFQAWRTRVNLVAGVGGFSPVVDAVVESSARQLIANGLPAGYETSLTYANWRSPCCPDPRQFHATTLDRLNEGCLFWVYMGHGRRTGLDTLATPLGRYPILDHTDIGGLHCAAGSPIAIFLACYTGAFDGPKRCLADEMLRSEGAPVAIVCGSRMTMPYGMTVFGAELLNEVFQCHAATIGEAILHAKRRSVGVESGGTSSRWLIDALAGAVSPPGSDLAAERREHVHLFNLLGDPLLRLRYPQQLALEAPSGAVSGGRIIVSGQSPVGGAGVIEIVADRRAASAQAAARQKFDGSADALATYQRSYQAANDSRLCSCDAAVQDGRFTATLDIPPGSAGRYCVRAFIAGEKDCALGTANLEIRAQ